MRTSTKALGATIASALALSLPAHAQQGGAQQENQQAGQSQCLQGLNELSQRMNEDGYWLVGYSGYGVGGTGTRGPVGTTGTMGGTAPGTTAPSGTAPTAAPTTGTGTGPASPWANVTWAERPQYEIRTLFRAARVLANNGNEEGCMTVANAAEQRYDSYVSQLRELGVEPQEITDWRQAQIVSAVPVNESDFPQRIENLIGADLRNVEDEDLGDIEDVVLDPSTGGVQYVIVSRGGFFGIGSEEVAVPWEHLRVVPGMNAYILPVNESAMEQAPQVSQDNLSGSDQTGIQQNEVEDYWRNTLDQ